jgi:hypothetical protein
VAAWLHEASVPADAALDVLRAAGTTPFHADVALTYGGDAECELDLASAGTA